MGLGWNEEEEAGWKEEGEKSSSPMSKQWTKMAVTSAARESAILDDSSAS